MLSTRFRITEYSHRNYHSERLCVIEQIFLIRLFFIGSHCASYLLFCAGISDKFHVNCEIILNLSINDDDQRWEDIFDHFFLNIYEAIIKFYIFVTKNNYNNYYKKKHIKTVCNWKQKKSDEKRQKFRLFSETKFKKWI